MNGYTKQVGKGGDDMKYVKWLEPYPGIDIAGNNVTCLVEKRATIDECVNMMRYVAKGLGKDVNRLSTKELLDEFMIVHHAEFEYGRTGAGGIK